MCAAIANKAKRPVAQASYQCTKATDLSTYRVVLSPSSVLRSVATTVYASVERTDNGEATTTSAGYSYRVETIGTSGAVLATATGGTAALAIPASGASVLCYRVTAMQGTRAVGTGTIDIRDGVDVWSIEAAVSVVSRGSDGAFTPAEVALYKRRSRPDGAGGTVVERVTDGYLYALLEYSGVAVDSAVPKYRATAGTAGVTVTCAQSATKDPTLTAIRVMYYDKDPHAQYLATEADPVMLASVRIPVVTEGREPDPGEDGLTLVVSPGSVSFRRGGGVQTAYVWTDAYNAQGRIEAGSEAGQLSIWSTTEIAANATAGLTVTCGYQNGRAYQRLRFDGTATVNKTIEWHVEWQGRKIRVGVQVTTTRELIVPPPQMWEDYPSDYAFQSGSAATDERVDMVLDYASATSPQMWLWRCTANHVKGTVHPYGDTAHWAGVQMTELVATRLLFAQLAFVGNLGVHYVKVMDPAGNVVVDMSPDGVTVKGKLYATEGEIRNAICENLTIRQNCTFAGLMQKSVVTINPTNVDFYMAGEQMTRALKLNEVGAMVEFRDFTSQLTCQMPTSLAWVGNTMVLINGNTSAAVLLRGQLAPSESAVPGDLSLPKGKTAVLECKARVTGSELSAYWEYRLGTKGESTTITG